MRSLASSAAVMRWACASSAGGQSGGKGTRRIVGWRVSSSLHTDLALDVEQALHERRAPREGLIHHSTGAVQYLSLRYTERLARAGIAPSVGAWAPIKALGGRLSTTPWPIIGLYKTASPGAARGVRGSRTRHPRMGV